MRVLVIDDEPDIQLLCRVNLSFDGHEVLEASDGAEGLRRAIEELPDVVILDVMLPRGDGFSVLAELQRREDTRHIPVIMLTALTGDADQARGWEGGAALYVTKPFAPGALCDSVRRVCDMPPGELRTRGEENVRLLSILRPR